MQSSVKLHKQALLPSLRSLPRSAAAMVLAALCAAPSAWAASQTWTNAPADATWLNVNNWINKAVPGGINMTGNSVNNDTVTFNAPLLASGIGGAANPVVPDDATVAGSRSRQIGSIVFDTADCGAYVFSSPSPAALPTATTPATGILNVSHNGSIRLNAAVTNSQIFLVPLHIRLPSSTAGIYSFINNASSPEATLFFASVTNQSANTRGTVFVLDGTNTGNNTIAALSAGVTTSGGNGLTKQGVGTWILSGPNDFRSSTVVSIIGGTLIVKDPGAFTGAGSGSGSVPVMVSNATLRIEGVTLSQSTFSLKGGGLIQMNGTGTLNGVTVDGSVANLSMSLATTMPGDVLTVGDGANKLTGGRPDTVLHVTGPGTVLLSQSANYVGTWSLDAGTTQIADLSALGTGATLNIGAGATLDFSPLSNLGYPGYSLTTAGLNAGGTGTATGSTAATINAPNMSVDLATGTKAIGLTFRPASFTGDTTHPALYVAQGTLSLGGNTFTVNNASGTPLGAGTYRLIQQAGGIITSAGGYAVLVTGSGLVSGAVGSIQIDNGNVNLVVSSYVSKNLTWQGGNPSYDWDLASTANWLNGGATSVFNNSDNVTFDSTGAGVYPMINLVGTLAPATITVDINSPGSYYFSGSGAISGAAGLIKKGTGTLMLQTVNTYQGSTLINNGKIQIGLPNALPAASDVTVQSPGVLDLSGNSDAIAGLNGNGTVDNLAGGDSVLDVGNNNANSTFSGLLQNTFGTLGLTKSGNGTLTLASSNSYAGPTTVNAGTMVLEHPYALGNGTSPLNTANGGVLDLNGHSIVVANLAGSGGTITNSGAAGTNTLKVLGTAATTFSGVLGENSTGARVQLVLLGNNELRLGGANTFSGGAFVGSGATLGINYHSSANPAGPGPILLSNNASLYLHQGSGGASTFVGNPVTIPDNSAATFTSSALGNGYAGSVTGSATATNLIARAISLSASNLKQYQSFLGRVVVQSGAELRWSGSTINDGGDNTTFEVNGTMHIKGGSYTTSIGTVSLGALTGTGYIDNPVGNPNLGTGVYIIGAKGEDSVYSGTFSGTNSLVKVGPARLTMNGAVLTTNTDSATFTNYSYAPAVSHFGATTISNGVLALVVPNNLNNSPAITLAGTGAVLDASQMGYISNQLDASLTATNQLLVTNGVFELYSGQTLAGPGTLQGSLSALADSTVSPGNGMGKLTVSGSAALGGLVTMSLNRTNASGTSDLLAARSITATGNLVVSNAGPDLVNGDSFKLFSVPVSGFTTVTLPATTSGGSAYVWDNRLAIDGTLQIVSGGLSPIPSTPTNLTYAVSGSTLTLSWPAGYTGWLLQVQTNHLASGVSTNALDWGMVSGAANTNRVDLTLDPAQPTRFYRMVHP